MTIASSIKTLSLLLITLLTYGCVSTQKYDTSNPDFYDEDFIELENTDMSEYSSIKQFFDHKQLCQIAEDCHVAYFGDAGCGVSGLFIYSKWMGNENIAHLKKIAANTYTSDMGHEEGGMSVCLGIGVRKPLLYCNEVCTDAFNELAEQDDKIYNLERKLSECIDYK